MHPLYYPEDCILFFSISFCFSSFSCQVWSSCGECSMSLMICHSSSATRSGMFAISSPSSPGCILLLKKPSPYLLYLIPVFLRLPFLDSVVMGRSASVHFGTSSYSGLFQSSSTKDPLSKPTSLFFHCRSYSCSRCHHFFLVPRIVFFSHLPRTLAPQADTRVLPCSAVRTSLQVLGREVSDFHCVWRVLCSSDRNDPAGALQLL